jgi:hypothetical protein
MQYIPILIWAHTLRKMAVCPAELTLLQNMANDNGSVSPTPNPISHSVRSGAQGPVPPPLNRTSQRCKRIQWSIAPITEASIP